MWFWWIAILLASATVALTCMGVEVLEKLLGGVSLCPVGLFISMESKTRLWRGKLSEKTITKERVIELERSLKNLNDQLLSARIDCDAKDDLIGKHAKVAKEAIAGREKAEAEAVSFKLKLDDALYQKATAEEKVTSIDDALKECVHQLHALKDEKHRIVNDASVNMFQEREKTRALEGRLADANQRLQQLSVEKNNLCGIFDMKEKLIKDLNVSKSQSEADFAAIVERLDFSEKTNESLKYEVLMLQKELVIRNQEREFNLKSAESAQKQHQENVRKINRLESECHRLRVMIQRRLPGPAAIAKMRSEVEMLRNTAPETRRKLNHTIVSSRKFAQKIEHDVLNKQLVKLHGVEDEIKILKETPKKKNGESPLSRIIYARSTTKLPQAEKQLKESSKGPTGLELARNSAVMNELSLLSVSEHGGNTDAVGFSESWASALMSQLEHFRNCKPAIGSSQSSLMDDFEEMEKLAIVCADLPEEGSSIEDHAFLAPKSLYLKPELLESMSKELVPLEKLSNACEFDHGDQPCFIQYEMYPTWLQDILKVIMRKHYTTQLNLDIILHEIRFALNKNKTSVEGKPLDPLFVGDNVRHSSFTSSDGLLRMKNFPPSEMGNQLLQFKLENALHQIIELIEGFIRREMPDNDKENLILLNDGHIDPRHKPASSTRQKACIFLWESSELAVVLERFVDVCKNMLCRQAEVEKFFSELASTLGWIIEHCFSLQAVPAMEETIKKNFGGDFLFFDDDTEVEVNIPKVANYETEQRTLKDSRGLVAGQKLISQILGTQLTTAKIELNETHQKFSSLEAELEQKSIFSEELKATSLQRQIQIESVSDNDKHKFDMVPEEKELRTDWEISAATEKLSECQETILQLGRQLKALSSPKNSALFDNMISSPSISKNSPNPKLLELVPLDNAKFEFLKSPQTKEIISSKPQKTDASFLNGQRGSIQFVLNNQESSIRHALRENLTDRSHGELGGPHAQKCGTEVGTLVNFPKKQKGGISLLKKLLSRKKKTSTRNWS